VVPRNQFGARAGREARRIPDFQVPTLPHSSGTTVTDPISDSPTFMPETA
jgi:hypothetical protein